MLSIILQLACFVWRIYYCNSNINHIVRTLTPEEIRSDIVQLYNNGQFNDLVYYLDAIEKEARFNYSLVIDKRVPSLYSYRGVALASHVFRDKDGAVKAFENATFHYPNDTRSWINLGNLITNLLIIKFQILGPT